MKIKNYMKINVIKNAMKIKKEIIKQKDVVKNVKKMKKEMIKANVLK